MPAPSDVIRSYGGGAVASQLIESMGPTDTSFAINPTTGWTEADGNPLGTVGPFVVVIDRFTDTVEKILCSSINLVTGLVTVYTSAGYSGRGYDGSNPQAHVPGGSTAGVQTCWSSVEAAEANAVVNQVLGQQPPPTTGQIFSWGAGGPDWVTNSSGLTGNPSGRIHFAGTQATVTGGEKLTGSTTDWALGGVTVVSDAIVVPITGKYSLKGGVNWPSNSNSGLYGAITLHNGTALANGGQQLLPFGAGGPAFQFNASFADSIACTANDTLALGAYQNIGNGALTNANSWLTVALESS